MPGQRMTLTDDELTDAGRLRRRNERCRTRLGLSFTGLATLTACVVRWCREEPLLTTRADIRDVIAEEASVLSPGFDELARLGLVDVAKRHSNLGFYKPTRRGILKVIELAGVRERARELRELTRGAAE
jgi:hypothetical protein